MKVLLAIFVALAIPTSQLRTITVVQSCCCPDPSNCHCPDHKADHSKVPAMRACHKTSHDIVAPTTPAFTQPELAIAPAPPHALVASVVPLASPHAMPPPTDPAGPS